MVWKSIRAAAFAGAALLLPAAEGMSAEVVLSDGRQVASVVHEDATTLSLAAKVLGRDLEALSGRAPRVSTRLDDCARTCVVIGRYDSALLRQLAQREGIDLAVLKGGWERYQRMTIRSRHKPQRQYLLIAGSDPRGAVYGVVDLTRELGISAWEWWADVTPRRRARVAADDRTILSRAPSVQYRGIFLNDEDWGLQPWAAKTLDPETGDIGPRTYARIYELLWRLKANTIWPAMHDSTKPFYQLPGNPEMARDYSIVVGTSHAEPMMRNNVREWDIKTQGPFNIFTNRANMMSYWQARAEEVKAFDNLTSVGLRGIHDSPMEGAKTMAEARDAVADVIGIQRDLLAKAQGRRPEQIPQVLTLYKEVLDVYKAGLKVPDDITLIWPDDNYGYISQLSTPAEAARVGGTGLYYHISYWGRPHDYLWLATTHPGLIREQLERAYKTGARKAWVVNVGDIKPAEYLTQYFLDLAFDEQVFAAAPTAHLRQWLSVQFGADQAREIADIMMAYYELAWERRPEFMGFGQTEPTTPNRPTAYRGEEAERRMARYQALVSRAEGVAAGLAKDRRDAFFELVLYPVRASANINLRILKLELAGQGGEKAAQHVEQARKAHQAIVADTAHYNGLANGKWRHMMDMAPRRLPVFKEPSWPAPGAAVGGAPAPEPRAPASVVSIAASTAVANPLWETVPELGSLGTALRAKLDLESVDAGKAAARTPLAFHFQTAASMPAMVNIVAIPVHPLSSANQLRLGYSLDDGPIEVLDFRTIGRSNEWKLNVLSNTAVKSISVPTLAAGSHRLRLYAMDPGFLLDRIDIVPEGAPRWYGAAPQQ